MSWCLCRFGAKQHFTRLRGKLAPHEDETDQQGRPDQSLRPHQPRPGGEREIDRAQSAVEAARGGDVDLACLGRTDRGQRIVGLIGHGGHDHGAISKEPIRPDKLEKRIAKKGENHENLDFPNDFRILGDGQIAGKADELFGIAQKRQTRPKRDHRGRGEKRRSLSEAAENLRIKNTWIAADHMHHPRAPVIGHEMRDRRP